MKYKVISTHLNDEVKLVINYYQRTFMPVKASEIAKLEDLFAKMNLQYDAFFYLPMCQNINWTKPFSSNIQEQDHVIISKIKELVPYYYTNNYSTSKTEEEYMERTKPLFGKLEDSRLENFFVMPIIRSYYQPKYGFPNHGLMAFFMKQEEDFNRFLNNTKFFVELAEAIANHSLSPLYYQSLRPYTPKQDEVVKLVIEDVVPPSIFYIKGVISFADSSQIREELKEAGVLDNEYKFLQEKDRIDFTISERFMKYKDKIISNLQNNLGYALDEREKAYVRYIDELLGRPTPPQSYWEE